MKKFSDVLSLLCLALMVWAAEGKHIVSTGQPAPGDLWSSTCHYHILCLTYQMTFYWFEM